MNQKKILYFALQSAFCMKLNVKYILFFGLLSILFSSCRIFNPSVMLRTPRDYDFSQGIDTVPESYVIQTGDILRFRLFSNQGFKIIDLTSSTEGGANSSRNAFAIQDMISYLVEPDSSVNLPILGRTKLASLSLKQAEISLEEKFGNYYNDPYITMEIINRRIIIFPGSGGGARVVQIQNEYTSLIEALALVGGITDLGKAHKVKVIRGDFENPEVFKINLSTIEGFAEARTYYVRANDIIYVEPSYRPIQQSLAAITQILSFTTSTIISVVYLQSLSN
jgi:polysaccharide export outer membrane protein